jgi:hypothetical protein
MRQNRDCETGRCRVTQVCRDREIDVVLCIGWISLSGTSHAASKREWIEITTCKEREREYVKKRKWERGWKRKIKSVPSSCADSGEEAGRVTVHVMGGWDGQRQSAKFYYEIIGSTD